MKIDRRQFNILTASFLASALAGKSDQLFAAPFPKDAADKFLDRLTFGSNPDSVAEFNALGKLGWLDEQLSLGVMDAALNKRLSAARLRIEYEAGEEEGPDDGVDRTWPARNEDIGYQYLDDGEHDLLRLVNFETAFIDWEERVRPARETQAAAFVRARHAKAQLREVMTQFWHDHFNVNSSAHEVSAAYFAQYDKMLRANAFGNFRKMLGEMTKSPAMLFYLNNEASEASPANENFARELLELHTLGAAHYVNGAYKNWSEVPGAANGLATGFIDEDVYEVARAFTGWTFGDGRYLAEGTHAPISGKFHYVDSWHDPYQKRVLAHELPPNSGPMADGEAVLDLLAAHRGTALHVCTKICRRLLMDRPPTSLVETAAEVFLANNDAPDQLGKVVRAIVLSPQFEVEPARKLKRPFEFLVSLYRRAGVDVASPSIELVEGLAKTGWRQHAVAPPTGHSDLSEHWANTSTLNGMVIGALRGMEPELIGSGIDFRNLMASDTKTWGATLVYWFDRFGGIDEPQKLAVELLTHYDIEFEETLPDDQEEFDWAVRSIIGLGALNPAFMFR